MKPEELRQLVRALYMNPNRPKSVNPSNALLADDSDPYEKLYNYVESFFRPEENGILPVFDKDALSDMLGLLMDAGKVAEEAFAEKERAYRQEVAQKGTENVRPLGPDADSERIGSMINLFCQLDPTKDFTLEEAMKEAEPKIIRVDGEINSVGGNMSRRHLVSAKLPNQDTVTGFFTDDYPLFNIDPFGKYKNMILSEREAHKEDPLFTDFCDEVLNSPYPGNARNDAGSRRAPDPADSSETGSDRKFTEP